MFATSRQAVIRALPTRAVQQLRLDDPFPGQPVHGASEPLNGPGLGLVAVQHADDITPRLLGPHPPDRGQPGIELGEDAVQVGGVAAGTQLADCRRVAGAEPWIAADPAAATSCEQPGFGALGNQRALELRDGAEHLHGQN
jgi:hypothetical protein